DRLRRASTMSRTMARTGPWSRGSRYFSSPASILARRSWTAALRSAAAALRSSRESLGPLVALRRALASLAVNGAGATGPRLRPSASRRLGVGRPLPGVTLPGVAAPALVVVTDPLCASAVDSAVASGVPAWSRRNNFTPARLWDGGAGGEPRSLRTSWTRARSAAVGRLPMALPAAAAATVSWRGLRPVGPQWQDGGYERGIPARLSGVVASG